MMNNNQQGVGQVNKQNMNMQMGLGGNSAVIQGNNAYNMQNLMNKNAHPGAN